jgi:hypothetical protein
MLWAAAIDLSEHASSVVFLIFVCLAGCWMLNRFGEILTSYRSPDEKPPLLDGGDDL